MDQTNGIFKFAREILQTRVEKDKHKSNRTDQPERWTRTRSVMINGVRAVMVEAWSGFGYPADDESLLASYRAME
ncbi:hypothetical protein Tco_0958952 [Tanacetum coccineum]